MKRRHLAQRLTHKVLKRCGKQNLQSVAGGDKELTSIFPNYLMFRNQNIISSTFSRFFKNTYYMFLRCIKVCFGNWDL